MVDEVNSSRITGPKNKKQLESYQPRAALHPGMQTSKHALKVRTMNTCKSLMSVSLEKMNNVSLVGPSKPQLTPSVQV